ncbi:phosphoesterase family-domain-containing protein [Gongronella butleri]|nr:phosphoesterase family-domain-containing protein [Gongronella butleri]
MKITAASILALTTLAVTSVAAAPHHHKKQHHHRRANGKGFDHILQVWFENQDYEVVAKDPNFDALLKEGILLDNFNAITHPSEPNYVAAVGGSNFGIDNDDYYNVPKNISSVFNLLKAKGLTWKAYQENIPSVGYTGFKSGTYVRKHNPAVIFDWVAEQPDQLKNIVPGTQLAKDIQAGSLPNWMFYTPDLNNDAHDTNVTYAGNWLKGFYQSVLSNPKFLEQTLILITFDEVETYNARNRVWSLLLGNIPKELKGTTDHTYYTHYSSLKTVEENWDLGSLGRGDAVASESNVFAFLTKKLGYKNVNVPESQIPWNNNTITGLLTGKSFNQTHTTGGTPPP